MTKGELFAAIRMRNKCVQVVKQLVEVAEKFDNANDILKTIPDLLQCIIAREKRED